MAPSPAGHTSAVFKFRREGALGERVCTELIADGDGRKIFIVDNMIESEELDKISEYLSNVPVTLTDFDRTDTAQFKHLKHDFLDSDKKCNDRFVVALAEMSRYFLKKREIGVGELYRAYLNVNLFGDFQFAHSDGEGWTALFFANNRWEEDWGGEIVFYPGDQDAYCYSIYPKPGRMLIFDGTIPHRGGVPSKFFHGPRMTLALKFHKA